MRRKKSNPVVPIMFAGITVAVIWTVATGAFWQWLPVLGACAVILAVLQVLEKDGKKK